MKKQSNSRSYFPSLSALTLWGSNDKKHAKKSFLNIIFQKKSVKCSEMYLPLFLTQPACISRTFLEIDKLKNQFWFGSKYLGTSANVGFNV